MRYGSVCSGIEAASLAWEPLGWEPQFFSEIEPFPCAVLAHHYGSNLPGKPIGNGVPNHGDMTKFKEWPDHAIDLLVGGTPCQSFSVAGLRAGLADPRGGNLMLTYLAIAAKYQPRWLLWENVPGVLSSADGRDFGTFLGALGQLGYGFAYRVLDAQFCRALGFAGAVPQRRRRVFVVGYLGDWRRAAAVLFDAASLRGDPAPRREAGQGIAPTISARTKGGGGLGTDFDLLVAFGGNDTRGPISAATAQNAHGGPAGRIDFESKTFIVAPVAGTLGQRTTDHPNGMKSESDFLIPVVADTLTANWDRSKGAKAGNQVGITNAIIREVRPINTMVGLRHQALGEATDLGVGGNGDPVYTLSKAHTHAVQAGWAVRRLTPIECCRLQGFPDDYFDGVTYRGKKPADGPIYKALGNSMAIPPMRVIGTRIAMVDAIDRARLAA